MEKAMNTRMGMRAKNCLLAAALLAASAGCTELPLGNDREEFPAIIEDWEEMPDTFKTQPDSVWKATHEDSVRLGLI